jgi:uncharacterized membrane protein YtjA (UPF0391 family)
MAVASRASVWRLVKSFYLLEDLMLRAALGFFILALVAVVFGASGVAGVSMEIGRMLLVVFLILAVISFVIGVVSGRGGPNIRP